MLALPLFVHSIDGPAVRRVSSRGPNIYYLSGTAWQRHAGRQGLYGHHSSAAGTTEHDTKNAPLWLVSLGNLWTDSSSAGLSCGAAHVETGAVHCIRGKPVAVQCNAHTGTGAVQRTFGNLHSPFHVQCASLHVFAALGDGLHASGATSACSGLCFAHPRACCSITLSPEP